MTPFFSFFYRPSVSCRTWKDTARAQQRVRELIEGSSAKMYRPEAGNRGQFVVTSLALDCVEIEV